METKTAAVESADVIEIGQVGGNLELDGWTQLQLQARGEGLQVQTSSGSVLVRARGNLVLSVPQSSRLVVTDVQGNLLAQNLNGSLELRQISGNVVLRDLDGSVSFSGAVGGKLHMENVADVAMNGARLSSGPNPADTVRGKVEQVTREAERKIRRAERKVLRHAQILDHRFESARWKFRSVEGTSASEEPGEAVSDEERLAVLKLLQEKKITSEQADKLLAALEGIKPS